jgi:hypothetical protein
LIAFIQWGINQRFLSKAAEHAARIAAVITMSENPDATEVTTKAMRGAIQVTNFYISEHLRLTETGRRNHQLGELRALWQWLKGRGQASTRDILQFGPHSLRELKKEGLTRLLTELKTRGYVREQNDRWEARSVQDDLAAPMKKSAEGGYAATTATAAANPIDSVASVAAVASSQYSNTPTARASI